MKSPRPVQRAPRANEVSSPPRQRSNRASPSHVVKLAGKSARIVELITSPIELLIDAAITLIIVITYTTERDITVPPASRHRDGASQDIG
jgi:hypothetical protein